MTYQELCGLSLNELRGQPCTCVRCGDCNGQGRLMIESNLGYPQDEPECCEQCDGTGFVESCDRCDLLAELEQE